MKSIICLISCLLTCNIIFSQENKETIYLLFNNDNKKTCKVETEFSHDNDGVIDGYKTTGKYRKKNTKNFIYFNICDEKFSFNRKKNKVDTCNIYYLKNIKFSTIDYINKKVKSSNLGYLFKNSIFKNIYIIEKISEKTIVKYKVSWAGETSIE
ncbi:hypothetical protein ACQY1Q_16975 [Tenacibaculum sp. TC6]|uniref:hypothetical protein n=1 Tax=Tenacibaculum sp. TC6 TaxID=3423223 RepID=UPI003D3668EC